MRLPDPEGDSTIVFDPLADLFFSVVGIVVLAVIILIPTLQVGVTAPPQPKATPAIVVDGQTVDPIRATATGLSFGPDGASTVALNAIGDDPVLAATIRRAGEVGTPLLILIEPDGDEAAFQLDPLLARLAVTAITQVRLDRNCGHMRSPTKQTPCPLSLGKWSAR